jgi:iron complex transport system ATP-binding protein
MSDKLLEVRGISYRYRPHSPAVLNELSMDIGEHSITAILGPNGAGKSTLLDLCLGWRSPECGQIILQGENLSSFSRRRMGRMMSLVPQNERVHFDYTVLEYLLLGRAPYLGQLQIPGDSDIKIADRALERVGLGELRTRSASRLSGGEHQLLMIARALVQEPRILILDEPTSQLDPGNRRRVVRLLTDLSSAGVTILFTTHDPTLAADIATHALLLKEGRVLKAGGEKEVLTGPLLSQLYETNMEVLRRHGKTIVFAGP